ncbi:hypothetical protein, partial [Mesorhizobium sanjuanii]|uniref:hypothetical protein n=1 Tax=Mesorhizobium sanjuanii TaxID=2037900 RepID=UPI0013FDC042
PWGIANGALWGAGGNVLAEGLSAVGSQVVARLAGRSANAEFVADQADEGSPIPSDTVEDSVDLARHDINSTRAPSAAGDLTEAEMYDLSLVPTKRTTTNKALRREWELLYGKPWPKDPATGRNMDVSHEKALADEGADHISNITHRTRADHIKRHSDAGDYARWARRRWLKQKMKGNSSSGEKR